MSIVDITLFYSERLFLCLNQPVELTLIQRTPDDQIFLLLQGINCCKARVQFTTQTLIPSKGTVKAV